MSLKRVSPRCWKVLWTSGAALVVLFLTLQLIRPNLNNPPVVAEISVPPHVRQILKKSCYDCHSNETRLRWFDQLAPASWIVARDVRCGRQALNFSEVGDLPPAKRQAILFEAINQIEFGAMPLAGYRWMHPSAAVSADELATLKDYLISISPESVANAAAKTAASKQRDAWLSSQNQSPALIERAPNGIPFFSDYKSWTAISTTERWDNQTMRLVLGNDVTIDAIRRGATNPWPKGAAFAKVAWAQDSDDKGNVETGEFLQVEFMIKDAAKYANTAGWGWARWRGIELKPYGDSPEFASECVRCHTPVKVRDYVFTIPLETSR